MTTTLQKIYAKIFDNGTKKINAKSVRDAFALMDDKIEKVDSGLKGVLKISDPKPTPDAIGKYELADLGKYTNLVPIIPFGSTTSQSTPITTTDGYYNAVYFDGAVFTQIKTKLPEIKLNEDDGALGYDLARDIFDIVEDVIPDNAIAFDNKTTGMFTKTERLAAYPNFQAINYTYQYTWKNYDVSNFNYLTINNGLIFRDGNIFQGLVGVKANGTVVNLLDANGITGAYPVITNKTFDIADFVKISGTFDENTSSTPFSGAFSATLYQHIKSKKLENLEKLVGNGGTSIINLKNSILANTPEPVLGIVGDSQESSVVQLNGKTFFYHTSGWGDEFIMAYDYDIETNTVSNGVKAIDGSKTGLSSTTHKCSNIFAFNGVIYALVSLWNPQNGVSLLKSTDGKNFTLVKNNFENGFFSGLNGNHCFIPEKINGYYYYFTEGRDGSPIWLTKVFRTKDDNLETANFEYLGVANGLRTEKGMAGGPSIHYQDGIFKCFYHYGPDGNLPTYLAYAEADLQNPTQFRPVYRPFLTITTNPFPHTDQIADPEIYELNGQCYMFAEFVDNTNGKTSVFRWKCAEGRLGEILRRKI